MLFVHDPYAFVHQTAVGDTTGFQAVLGSGMKAKNRSGKVIAQAELTLYKETNDKQANKCINNYRVLGVL